MSRNFKENLKYLSIGAVAGMINGFFGAGAGLVLVPLMTYVGKLDSKKSHATTLACVLFMCVSGSVIYFVNKVIDYKLILICVIGSVIGALVGSKLLKNLKNNIIDLIFAIALICAGICMIIF